MSEVATHVLTKEDLDASPFLLGMGAQEGDTVTVTRPDSNAGGEGGGTAAGGETAATPKEGDTCTTEDGKPGTLVGDKASGTLVCQPSGDSQ